MMHVRMFVTSIATLALTHALLVAPALATGGSDGRPGGVGGAGGAGQAGNGRPAGGSQNGGGGGGKPSIRPSTPAPSTPPSASRPSNPAPSRPAPASPPAATRPPAARTQPVSPPRTTPVAPPVTAPRNLTPTAPSARPSPSRNERSTRPTQPSRSADPIREPARTLPMPTRRAETARPPETPSDAPIVRPIEERLHERIERRPDSRPTKRGEIAPTRDTTREIAEIPENKTRFGATPPLQRFDRNFVPPNKGASGGPNRGIVPPPATTSGTYSSGSSSNCNGSGVDVNFWFNDPCNRFVTWRGCSGYQFGYVFCGPSLYWYWWRPGCSPSFYPYSYYWTPSCYYLPAYYPTYATVRYVDDYYDDGAMYSSYGDESAGGAPPADASTLIVTGWTQFLAGTYPDAVESFRQAVLADPADVQAKIGFAQALFAIGNYGDAAFLIRRTIELLPDWPVIGDDPRGRYADPLDHAEQMVALRAFLDRVPGEPAATLVLAVQSYFTGDLTAAREAFTALALLDTEDLVAQRFLVRLGPEPAPKAPTAAPAAAPGTTDDH